MYVSFYYTGEYINTKRVQENSYCRKRTSNIVEINLTQQFRGTDKHRLTLGAINHQIKAKDQKENLQFTKGFQGRCFNAITETQTCWYLKLSYQITQNNQTAGFKS